MTKAELTAAVNKTKSETHDALQTVYENLNKGQQKKLMKDDKVRELFERYHVLEASNGEN